MSFLDLAVEEVHAVVVIITETKTPAIAVAVTKTAVIVIIITITVAVTVAVVVTVAVAVTVAVYLSAIDEESVENIDDQGTMRVGQRLNWNDRNHANVGADKDTRAALSLYVKLLFIYLLLL